MLKDPGTREYPERACWRKVQRLIAVLARGIEGLRYLRPRLPVRRIIEGIAELSTEVVCAKSGASVRASNSREEVLVSAGERDEGVKEISSHVA